MLKEKKALEILSKRGLTLAIAESCTGGELANRITNIPGSSQVFLLGIIAYSNQAKNRLLKIPKSVIQAKGAVSYETVKLLAVNIAKLSGAAIGMAITGIAGPTGGSKAKPIGTVLIALASDKKAIAQIFHFSGNRLQIKRMASEKALDMLLKFIG
ncbi:MAG: hypothetical protein A3J51_02210 [Omnitrophica WOR_2 bacterium RIFCSPHIGHO2_02_FULL_45_21]|nr:MAG: hypothetical protein A3J51_02210 [Omnitrophica WOR_2 bacterium RIFCSPHIGHO2_02_FULL_45_21]